MTSQTKLYQEQFASAFQRKERSDGTPFYCLRDDLTYFARELFTDAIYDACAAFGHGSAGLPDWVYQILAEMTEEALTCDEDELHEHADAAVDIYTASLYRWMADYPDAREWVEIAREEFELTGESMDKQIQYGQYLAIRAIYHVVRSALCLGD